MAVFFKVRFISGVIPYMQISYDYRLESIPYRQYFNTG